MIKKSLTALILMSGIGIANAIPVNLVVNGDFSNGGTGWILSGNTGYNSYPDAWRNGAVNSNAFLSQTISTTAGEAYDLNFQVWQSTAGYQEFGAIWNGTQIFFNNVGNSTWNSLSFSNLIATNSQTTLQFFNRNNPEYNYLDNVSVVRTVVQASSAVPEPTSIALLGMGALGFAASRRKKSV